jgi:hypothetical protein
LLRWVFFITVSSVFVHTALDAQTIYKYTDKNGAVVLTDKPPAGVKAEPFVTGEPATKSPGGKNEPYMEPPSTGSMTADEAIRQRDQKLDEVVRTIETRDREKELERQKRLQEADRLEAQAREPVPATRENLQRQYELLQQAEKLRREQ